MLYPEVFTTKGSNGFGDVSNHLGTETVHDHRRRCYDTERHCVARVRGEARIVVAWRWGVRLEELLFLDPEVPYDGGDSESSSVVAEVVGSRERILRHHHLFRTEDRSKRVHHTCRQILVVETGWDVG